MCKNIFLFVTAFMALFNVNASDSTKVNLLLKISSNAIISKPNVFNTTGGQYYTGKNELGFGYSFDFSTFFNKHIGIEAGFTTQRIPTTLEVNIPLIYEYGIPPTHTEFSSVEKDSYISVGPEFKLNILKKVSFNFVPCVLFTFNKKAPVGIAYINKTDDSYLLYHEINDVNSPKIEYLLKPSIAFSLNKFMSLKINYIIRFSKNNIINGYYNILPEYPDLNSTGNFGQKANYQGLSLSLELQISEIKNSIINKLKK